MTEAKDAAAQLEKLGKQISAQTHDLAQMRSQLAAAAEALASSQVCPVVCVSSLFSCLLSVGEIY